MVCISGGFWQIRSHLATGFLNVPYFVTVATKLFVKVTMVSVLFLYICNKIFCCEFDPLLLLDLLYVFAVHYWAIR